MCMLSHWLTPCTHCAEGRPLAAQRHATAHVNVARRRALVEVHQVCCVLCVCVCCVCMCRSCNRAQTHCDYRHVCTLSSPKTHTHTRARARRLLLSHGASIGVVNALEQTPLHLARSVAVARGCAWVCVYTRMHCLYVCRVCRVFIRVCTISNTPPPSQPSTCIAIAIQERTEHNGRHAGGEWGGKRERAAGKR
jgi:hypothetical protein